MPFLLSFAESANADLEKLSSRDERRFRKVRKTLGHISHDPKYPGLHSHKYSARTGPSGEEIWESYVENRTPDAWRVFWYYGPDAGTITVIAITPHP